MGSEERAKFEGVLGGCSLPRFVGFEESGKLCLEMTHGLLDLLCHQDLEPTVERLALRRRHLEPHPGHPALPHQPFAPYLRHLVRSRQYKSLCPRRYEKLSRAPGTPYAPLPVSTCPTVEAHLRHPYFLSASSNIFL